MEQKKFKLPKEFTIKWLEALRSGKYPQAEEELFNGTGYCCIGVAGMICGIPKKQLIDRSLFVENSSNQHGGYSKEQLDSFIVLPKELLGAFSNDSLVGSLVNRNDGMSGFKKHSFSEIADWIEENVELY